VNAETKEQSRQWIQKTSQESLNKHLPPESWWQLWQLFSGTGKECWRWNSCNKGPQ
jgi:hypothetical protein